MQQKLAAPADAVWQVVGAFGTIHEWLPAIVGTKVQGQGVGAERYLSLPDGEKIVERLEARDDAARSYTYSILTSPLPVAIYTATIQVVEDGPDACTVKWSSEFEPEHASDDEAAAVIEGIYNVGFEALRQKFGA